ncbi:glycosyltransferase involved in cell wall biosynthesis [Methanocalculus alkaliphilus]|uniref:glycosyltransferase family 4 protein n=1 Tax=Methanocalculus alkaliphilus TaxID=768730 RepID=UPI0020A0D645|nr:glycosyltransferase family 4 protein [Methanocalculus alkaliphilus]MCP1715124.1 glycosyltransferase involved in cell wall biosynthesis [Methanocalculus alkaliphilus]
MKMAYFSPLPPQKSGISNYSELLLPYLGKYYDIDVWVFGQRPNTHFSQRHDIIDYKNNRSIPEKLKNYDVVLYNIGNNPEFHSEIYETFLHHPGIVILHDYVIYYLVTGYFLNYKDDREKYIQEFFYNYGIEGIDAVKHILRGYLPPLQYPHPERYPLLRRLIETAPGIIVHSESTRKMLIDIGCSPSKVVTINFLIDTAMPLNCSLEENREQRRRYGISEDDILISSFGYVAPTKRNEQVISVVNEIVSTTSLNITYLMVGEGNYIDGLLSNHIKKTGFTSMEEYEKLLCASDIVVNLRYPSMGECSMTLIQALTVGKSCIVSNNAWFSELPDNVVMKIPVDIVEERHALKDAILSLIYDNEKRMELGRNAHEYVFRFHDPSYIAERMHQFFNYILDTCGDLAKKYD